MKEKIKNLMKKYSAEIIVFGSGLAVTAISIIIKVCSKNTNGEADVQLDKILSRTNESEFSIAARNFFKDHPDMTYDDIYKEMNVDMSEEDTEPYKEAEIEFFKKHGYM